MGQHSAKPSRTPSRKPSRTPSQKPSRTATASRTASRKNLLAPGKRRWTAIAAGAAALAIASTAAWASVNTSSTTTMATAGSRVAVSPTTPSTTSKPTPTESTPSKFSAASPSQTSSSGSDSSDSSASPDKPKSTSSSPKPKSSEAAKSKKSEASGPRVISTGTCGASFYGDPQMTASGEQFDPTAMTAAHKSLPLGSKVRVTNPNNGESVTVRINDRGPYVGGRCLDLSEAAFDAIGDTGAGVMTVKYEVLAS